MINLDHFNELSVEYRCPACESSQLADVTVGETLEETYDCEDCGAPITLSISIEVFWQISAKLPAKTGRGGAA